MLLERLGVGGMSQVDLARKGQDDDFVRFVVIKRIKAERTSDDAFVRMFRDEARITSELHHANIASVYDFGRLGDEYFMALEFVPGVDVRVIVNTLRERGQAVPPAVALRIIYDVLQALQYAHTKVDSFGKPMQIVHRDVNPRNIMVSIRGETKLIDFGVARATNRLERTRTDHVKGKFAYMAPEQMTNEDIDGRADLFAVGLTLYEMVRGYGPFYGLSQVQIMHRLVGGRIPELDGPTPGYDGALLKQVYERSTALNVAERYPDAATFAREVERLAQASGGLATQSDMERFLRYLQPDLAERVEQKMTLFAAPIGQVVRRISGSADGLRDDDPGTMSGVRPTQTNVTITHTALAAGGAFAGVVVMALVLFGIGGALGIYLLWSAPTPAPVQTVQVSPPPAEDAGTQASSGTAEVEPTATAPATKTSAGSSDKNTGGPASTGAKPSPGSSTQSSTGSSTGSSPGSSTRSSPKTSSGGAASASSADGSPAASPPEDVPPADAGTDAPSGSGEDAATEPPPEPKTVPDTPSETGVVQVTSSVRGRAIRVDGKLTSDVTPKALELPTGVHIIEVEGYPAAEVDVGKNQRKPLVFR